MKRFIPALVTGVAVIGLGLNPSTAAAQDTSKAQVPAGEQKVAVKGSLRLRGEGWDAVNLNEGDQAFLLTQVRLGVTWKIVDNLKVGVTLQDARILGEDPDGVPAINDQATPNIYADAIAVHEGFIEAKANGPVPITVKIGRQKFNLGAKRLVASLEWVNTARVWDGMRTTVGDTKGRSADIIISRLVAVDPIGPNGLGLSGNRYFDSYFHTAYYTDKLTIPKTQTEGYVMMRHENGAGDLTHTWGFRTDTKANGVRFDTEVAVQGGRFGFDLHRAMMAHGGIGYTADNAHKPGISAAYNFGTGDADPNDGVHTTFDNLYPLNHAYYGYMDLVSLQNMHNAELVGQIKPFGKASLRVGYQNFWLAQPETDAWYNAGMKPLRQGQDGARPYVGSEIDVTFKAPIAKGKVGLAGGISRFIPGDFTVDTGASNPASFAWLQTAFKW